MARSKQTARKASSQFTKRAWQASSEPGSEEDGQGGERKQMRSGEDGGRWQQPGTGGQPGEQDGSRQSEPARVAEALLRALQAAPPPGEFAAGGELSFVLPGLEVLDSSSGSWDAVGLPLSAAAAAALKSRCELARAGGGSATAGDAEASQAWQLDPARFRLSNPQWQKVVDAAIDACREELGVADEVEVEARPHKLLVCPVGVQPAALQGAEAAEDAWGTLVVHLPTAYKGGQLVVSHGRHTKVLDFAAGSAYGMHYAAFYADCNHEVKPVTSGHRVSLVYRLTYTGPRPRPHDRSAAVAAAKAVVQRWEREEEEEDKEPPAKLVYLLEHRYTQQELRAGMDALLDSDCTAAQVLAELQEEGLLDVHLALMQRNDWGPEVCDYDDTVQQWVGLDGQPAPHWGTMRMETYKELCQAACFPGAPLTQGEYFDDIWFEPDGVEGSLEPTSDEETIYRRWYHRSALVVWPKSWHWDMMGAGGLKPAADGLLDAVQQGSLPPPALHEWAAALLRTLPESNEPDAVGAVLAAVAQLGDAQVAEQCLGAILTVGSQHSSYSYSSRSAVADCIASEHASALAQLCQLCGWSAPCVSAVGTLLAHLADAGMGALDSCTARLRHLHTAAAAPDGAAAAAAATAVAAAGAAAPADATVAVAADGGAAQPTASAQPGSAASCDKAAMAGLLRSTFAKAVRKAAHAPRADTRRNSVLLLSPERHAHAAVGMAQLLGLVREWSNEAALDSFLITFARHFTAAGAQEAGACSGGSSAGDGSSDAQPAMVSALVEACQQFGWGSPRTAAVLSATAAACASSSDVYGNYRALALGVQTAAGQHALALEPQLTAAFLKALPPPVPLKGDAGWPREVSKAQALLDWLAEQGSAERFGALFKYAAVRTLGLGSAVDVALQVGPAKGWWAELQPGLLAAFGRDRSEHDMPAALAQLQRVQQAMYADRGDGTSEQAAGSIGDGTRDAAAGSTEDGRQRYLQLAAAVVGAVEREPDRDMNVPPRAGLDYYSTTSGPPRTADFVRDLLLAAYVPGCSDAEQLMGRAAAHVCRCPLRYPAESVVLPALGGFAQQLQLASLAAAVHVVPALRVLVQHAADSRPQPPAPPSWSLPEGVQGMRCNKRNCADCPAVRAFLEDAQQSRQRIEMEMRRRRHVASVIGGVRKRINAASWCHFTWTDDGAAIVLSKRGDLDIELAEHKRKHSTWQQLQAALGGEYAHLGGSGSGVGTAQQQQEGEEKQRQQEEEEQQQQQAAGAENDPADGSPPAKKQRL